MKIVLLPEAEDDIDRLYGFLFEKNPLAAQKAMLAIDEGLQTLKENPHAGVKMQDRPNDRQLFIPFGKSAYVLRYRIQSDVEPLIVIRIWHGRENRS